MKDYLHLLKRILQGQVDDIKIPQENIGEGKEFQWRSSSRNGQPILIHNESGTAVSGAGIDIAQSKVWVKPKQEKPDLEYVESIPSGIHKGKPGVKYTTKNGDVSYMSAKMFSDKELQAMKGYPQKQQEPPPPPPKPKNVLIQKIKEPSVQKYKDFQDACTSMQQEGHELEGFEKLKKFPWEHMSTVMDSMRTFAQEFPNYKLTLGIANTIPVTSYTAFYITSAYLPQDLMTPAVLQYFKGKTKTTKQGFNYRKSLFEHELGKNTERGHHPPNQTVGSMIYHELWHALSNEMIRRTFDDKCRFARKNMSDSQFAHYYRFLNDLQKKLCYAICKEAGQAIGYKSNQDIRKCQASISQYALKNFDETIAEAFCDVYANGEQAAGYSRLLYKTAKKYAAMSVQELKGEINNVE